jgi:uncharacterized protein YukE
MATIKANYGAMSAGHEGLVATWGRIEAHLGQLDSTVASTSDMSAEALTAFRLLKAKWDGSAADRQVVLKGLAQAVGEARAYYQQVDRTLAAQFPG